MTEGEESQIPPLDRLGASSCAGTCFFNHMMISGLSLHRMAIIAVPESRFHYQWSPLAWLQMDKPLTAEQWSRFYAYYDELVTFLRWKLQSREQAMDVAQETYLRLLTKNSSAPILNPRAFLYKTAANLSIDLFRKRRRHAEESLELDRIRESLVAPAEQERIVEAKEQVRLLSDAVMELPLRCRQVFILHKFQHHSHAEIAEHFGISTSMVEKHIIKATAHCRNRFKDLPR